MDLITTLDYITGPGAGAYRMDKNNPMPIITEIINGKFSWPKLDTSTVKEPKLIFEFIFFFFF